MAGYNELLIGRWNRFFQKLTGIKGSKPVQSLGPEIMPVHPLFHGVENRYLESWNIFSIAFQIVAVAAVQGGLRLRNPKGSNVVAVFERISFFNNTQVFDAPEIQTQSTTADSDLVIAGLPPLDNRSFAGGVPTGSNLVISQTNAVGTALQRKFKIIVPANVTADFVLTDNQEVPILPGDALQIQSSNPNQAVWISVRWRERFIEESERT